MADLRDELIEVTLDESIAFEKKLGMLTDLSKEAETGFHNLGLDLEAEALTDETSLGRRARAVVTACEQTYQDLRAALNAQDDAAATIAVEDISRCDADVLRLTELMAKEIVD